jgi:hypothetical protein
VCRQKRSLLQSTCSQLGTVPKSSRRDTCFEDVQCNRISFIHQIQQRLKIIFCFACPYKIQRDSSLLPHSPSLLTSFSSRLALLLQLSAMFSLSKIALFSLISFATLALAIPAPEPRTASAKDLLSGACAQVANIIQPLCSSTCLSFSFIYLYAYGLRIAYCTPSNNTAYYIDPIVSEVTSTLTELIAALKGSDLGCTVQELLELVANLLQVLLPSSSAVFPLTLTICGTDYPWTAWYCMRFKLRSTGSCW